MCRPQALYGAESDQLGHARSTVEERAGAELVEEWVAPGATRDPLWAVDHAIDVLS